MVLKCRKSKYDAYFSDQTKRDKRQTAYDKNKILFYFFFFYFIYFLNFHDKIK